MLLENTNPHRLENMFKHVQNSEKDWEEFRIRFERVDADFIKNLQNKYPQLSNTDIRICSLIKLNLSSKEIGNMLNITSDSVNKSRYRIRKKLDLPKEKELNQFIASV